MSEELMIVEKFIAGEWKEIKFEELTIGDKFRMILPSGHLAVYDGDDPRFKDSTEWIASSEVYTNEDGVLTVESMLEKDYVRDDIVVEDEDE